MLMSMIDIYSEQRHLMENCILHMPCNLRIANIDLIWQGNERLQTLFVIIANFRYYRHPLNYNVTNRVSQISRWSQYASQVFSESAVTGIEICL